MTDATNPSAKTEPVAWRKHDGEVLSPVDGSPDLFDFIMANGVQHNGQKAPRFWHGVSMWRPHVSTHPHPSLSVGLDREALQKAAQMAGDAFWSLPMPKHWDRDKGEYSEWCAAQSKRIRDKILALAAPAETVESILSMSDEDIVKGVIDEGLDPEVEAERVRIAVGCNNPIAFVAPAEGWQPIETAPKDGTVIIAMARYRDATAGFPCFVAFMDGAWRELGRSIMEPMVCWAWKPRDILGTWPAEHAACLPAAPTGGRS